MGQPICPGAQLIAWTLIHPQAAWSTAMNIQLITNDAQLAELRPQWERLERGVPFRSWRWLHTWWQHFKDAAPPRSTRELYAVAVVNDEQQLMAFAPWYVENTPRQGRQLRWLGSGEVCTDYQTVLCRPGWEAKVAECLADFLAQQSLGSEGQPAWNQISLEGVDAEDTMMCHLAKALAERDLLVYGHPDSNCWRIDLPASWDEYLDRLSASHRKQLRQLQRREVQSGCAVLHTAANPDSVAAAWPMLLDLHRRRRHSLGEAGSFELSHTVAFHFDALRLLAEEGRARIHWLECDGRPVAAEYHLLGDGVTYAYQSGMNPLELAREPGRVLQMMLIQLALADGMRTLDLLRGDEPYKAHWRARPRAAIQLWVLPQGFASRVRQGMWAATDSLRQWMRSPLPNVVGNGTTPCSLAKEVLATDVVAHA